MKLKNLLRTDSLCVEFVGVKSKDYIVVAFIIPNYKYAIMFVIYLHAIFHLRNSSIPLVTALNTGKKELYTVSIFLFLQSKIFAFVRSARLSKIQGGA